MRKIVCAAALLLVPMLALAQAQAKPSTVTVTAQGSFKTAPDTVVVSMQVTGKNADLKMAYAQAQSQAAEVRALLRSQGFTPEQARWSGFEVQPDVDYKTDRVTGYTVSNDLELQFTDFAKIGSLLNAATGKGLNALRNIGFTLAHPEKARAAAIADAFKQAQNEAAALAQAAGLPLDGLQSVSVNASGNVVHPLRRFTAMAVEAAPAPTAQFTPQQITVTANITAVFNLGH